MSEQINFKQPSGHLGQESVQECTAHQLPFGDGLVPYACLFQKGCVKCPVATYASEHGVTPDLASKGKIPSIIKAGIGFTYMKDLAGISQDRLEGTLVAGHSLLELKL